MKVVRAIIKPFKLNDVHNALFAMGVSGMTVFEAIGHGHQKGHSEVVGDLEYVAHFIPKICIEVIVTAEMADSVVRAIMIAARTGQSGDGKVYVFSLDQLQKIRTGESGPGAL
jgi:nitrogen regulatory protein P-II 2